MMISERSRTLESSFAYLLQRAPLFCGAYVLWLFFALLNTSAIEAVSGLKSYAYVLVVCLLFLHELSLGHWTSRDLQVFMLLFGLNVQTYVRGGNDLMALALFGFCGRKLPFRRIGDITIYISMAIVIVLGVLAVHGDIPNVINVRENGTIRYGMGFAYVTYMPYVILNVVSLRVYSTRGRLGVTEGLFWISTGLLAMRLTDSRNSCILIIGLVLACYLVSHRKAGTTPGRTTLGVQIVGWSFCWATVLFLFLSVWYSPDSPFYAKLNDFFSHRLWATHHAIENFGLPVIGGTDVPLEDLGLIIDDSYMRIIFDHGVIALVFVLYVYTVAMRRAIHSSNWHTVLVLFVLAMHSLFDAQLISIQQNCLMLLSIQAAFGYVTLEEEGVSRTKNLLDGKRMGYIGVNHRSRARQLEHARRAPTARRSAARSLAASVG